MDSSTYRLVKAVAIVVAVIIGAAFLFWYVKENSKDLDHSQVSSRSATDFNDINEDTTEERNTIGFKYSGQDANADV